MTDFARLVLASDTTGLVDARTELAKVTASGNSTEKNVTRATDKMSAQFRHVGMAAAKMAAGLVATLASGKWLAGAIRETEQLDRNMRRMDAVITATGGAAGRSASQLHEQARELALATLASTEGIMSAQTTLLTFRNVTGEVFDGAIAAALDMSEALGTDLNGAIMQLGKALEDPVRGMNALSRSGTVFTDAQRAMVKSMVEAGDVAGAQRFILKELENQYGGTARAAAGGLAGAQDTLTQRIQETSIAFASAFGLIAGSQFIVENMATAVQYLGDNMDSIRIVAMGAAAVITGMYTPAIVGAVFQTGLWIASLITLRGALLATGIGALIVGAGMLIDFLLRLRSATGSWGEALSALGDLAAGVWEGIKTSAASIAPALGAIWETVKSGFYSMLQGISENWGRFLDNFSASIPDLPGFGWAIDAVSEASGRALDSMGKFNFEVEKAGNSAERLKKEAASLATQGFDKAKAALDKLTAIMAQNGDETTEAADAARELSKELDNVASGSGGAAAGVDKVTDATKEAERAARDAARAHEQWANNAAGHFDGLITGGKSFGDVLKSIARQLESSAWQQLFSGMGGGSRGGLGGIFKSILGGGFGGGGVKVPTSVLSAIAPSFDGGGYTGNGPRSGGLDGKGGFIGLLHPQERVVDYTKGQTAQGGGAPSVNVSFNIDARGSVEGEAHRLGAYMRQAAPDIERRVIAAIQNKRGRGHAV